MMRALLLASAALLAFVTAAVLWPAPQPAVACSGDPERFDELVREADLIAIVRAENIGGALNTAPTVQPTFTPFPEATTPPYPRGDFTGIGATVKVIDVISGGDVEPRITADTGRRAWLEADDRNWESVWPGMAGSNCALQFQQRYETGAFYIALYAVEGLDYRTMRLVKIVDSHLDPDHDIIGPNRGLGITLAMYNRFFADVPAEIYDSEDDQFDYAYVARPDIPTARFVAFIRSVRGELTPPETGSAGLR